MYRTALKQNWIVYFFGVFWLGKVFPMTWLMDILTRWRKIGNWVLNSTQSCIVGFFFKERTKGCHSCKSTSKPLFITVYPKITKPKNRPHNKKTPQNISSFWLNQKKVFLLLIALKNLLDSVWCWFWLRI